jgi:two-component system, NtrC family, sensor kinase
MNNHPSTKLPDDLTPLSLVGALIESLNNPFAITDNSGIVVLASHAFFPLFAIGRSVVRGESLSEFLDEKSRSVLINLYDDPLLAEGKTIQTSVNGLRRDGSEISLLISLSRIEKNADYYLLVFEDCSEKMREQGKMEKLEHQAAIGTFTSIVAHEFNNVLAGIRGYAQLMKSDPTDLLLAKKASVIIEQETTRGAEICRNLSLYSGAHRLNLEPVNLADLIERSIELQKSQITDNTTIETRLESIKPVLVDRHRIQQIFINLITNAYHAVMPKGGGKIIISLSYEKDTIVIQVEDNGIGIPAYNLSKIFDPFFTSKTASQGSLNSDTSPRGTGLGLPVCQVIVLQHGGSIDVASSQGEGTVFTVKIPAKFAAADTVISQKFSSIRALVVDDDMPVREVIFRALSHVNVEASLAHNASEFNRLIQTEHYDIIFLDYVLPEMNADRLLPTIKEKLPDARIVIISGWTGSPIKKSSIEKNVDAWIEKPFNVEAILKQLEPFKDMM